MFASVYDNDRALACWIRLLMLADAMWPASAPLPAKTATVRQLIDAGLVIERPGGRYTIRGLDKERQSRSDSARNAAAMRWQSASNAGASGARMPRRDETRKDKTSSGANAPTPLRGDRAHRGQHPDCIVCHPVAS